MDNRTEEMAQMDGEKPPNAKQPADAAAFARTMLDEVQLRHGRRGKKGGGKKHTNPAGMIRAADTEGSVFLGLKTRERELHTYSGKWNVD
ncbi:hypothetical protein ZHAS_00003704 [Anopheles sinensis]|uniref:Uncharacterized protein n=1 Tax=Anopheles sinensis TaxID=74873 RepID=A0A084VFA4_ANOSI|nr:hypothetical protein ZHAS_00003704 [Anopheles sinensis]